MDILVTAFTPFGDFSENISAKVLQLLSPRVEKLLLPTSYEKSFLNLKAHLEKHPADAVVLLGQAGADRLRIERVALNVADCSVADNDGVVMRDQTLLPSGENAYFSTLPIHAMASAGDCVISNTAGVYVCNCLMYKTLHFLKDTKTLCGFIHIPQNASPDQCAAQIEKMLTVLEK